MAQDGGEVLRSILLKSEHDIAASRFKAVLAAIKDKDADALKSEFSKKALSEAYDIYGSIDYLFGLVKGDVVSWEERTLGSGETIQYGNRKNRINVWDVFGRARFHIENLGLYSYMWLV